MKRKKASTTTTNISTSSSSSSSSLPPPPSSLPSSSTRAKRAKTLRNANNDDNDADNASNSSSGLGRWELNTTIDRDQGVLDLIAEYQRGEEAGYTCPDPGLERMLVRAVCERGVPLVAGCFGDISEAQAQQNDFMWSVGHALFAEIPGVISPNRAVLCGRLIRALLPPVLQAAASAAFTEGIIQDAECLFARTRNKLPATLLPDTIAAATSSPFLSTARQRALIDLAVRSAENARSGSSGDILPARLAVACAEAPLNIASTARASFFGPNTSTYIFHSRTPACAAEWYVAAGRILYHVLAQSSKALIERKNAIVTALSRAFVARPTLADNAAMCLCQVSAITSFVASAPSSSSTSSSSSPSSSSSLFSSSSSSLGGANEAEGVTNDLAALAAFLFCATAHMGMGGPRLSAERVLARILCRLPSRNSALVAAGSTAAFSSRAFALLLALAGRLCSTGNGALAIAVLRQAASTTSSVDGRERIPGLKLKVFLELLRYAGQGVEPFPAICAGLETLSKQISAALGSSGDERRAESGTEAEIEGALHECLRDKISALSADSCYTLVSAVAPLICSTPGLFGAALNDVYALETEHFEHGVAGICALLGSAPAPHVPALAQELASCWNATKSDPACVAFFLKHLSSAVPRILEVAAISIASSSSSQEATDSRAPVPFINDILGQFLLVSRAREARDPDSEEALYWVLDYGFLRSRTSCLVALLWCCCNTVLALEDESSGICRSRMENYGCVADILGGICRDLGRGLASNGLRDMVAFLDEDPTLASALSLVATLLAAFAWSRAGARSADVPAVLPILDVAAALSAKAADVYATLVKVDASVDGSEGDLAKDLAKTLMTPGSELAALPPPAVSLIASLAYEVLLGNSKSKHDRDAAYTTYLTLARCLELASRWGEPYLNLKNMCLVAWATFTHAAAYSPTAGAVVVNDAQMLVLRPGGKLDYADLIRSLQVAALGAITTIIADNGQLFANVSRTVFLLSGVVDHFCSDVADKSKASRKATCEVHVSLLQAYSAALQALCKAIPSRTKTPALLRLWAVLDPPAPASEESISSTSRRHAKKKAPTLAISTSLVIVQLLLDYLSKREAVLAVKAFVKHCAPDFAAPRKGVFFTRWCADGKDGGLDSKSGKGASRNPGAVKLPQEITIAPWTKAFSCQVVSKCLSTLIKFVPLDSDDNDGNGSNSLPLLESVEDNEAQTFLCICSVASYFFETKVFSGDTRIESRVTSLALRLVTVMERHLATLCAWINEVKSTTIAKAESAGKGGEDRSEADDEQLEEEKAELEERAEMIARFIPLFEKFASLTAKHNSKFRNGVEEQNLAKKIKGEAAIIYKFLGKAPKRKEGKEGDNEDDDDDDGKIESKKPAKAKRLRQQRSKRSRNAFIDANLTNGMDDTYADLEDFIVCAPNTEYSAQETERELNNRVTT